MRSVTGPTFSMRHSNYSAVEGAVALMESGYPAVAGVAPEAESAALPSSCIEFREWQRFAP